MAASTCQYLNEAQPSRISCVIWPVSMWSLTDPVMTGIHHAAKLLGLCPQVRHACMPASPVKQIPSVTPVLYLSSCVSPHDSPTVSNPISQVPDTSSALSGRPFHMGIAQPILLTPCQLISPHSPPGPGPFNADALFAYFVFFWSFTFFRLYGDIATGRRVSTHNTHLHSTTVPLRGTAWPPAGKTKKHTRRRPSKSVSLRTQPHSTTISPLTYGDIVTIPSNNTLFFPTQSLSLYRCQ